MKKGYKPARRIGKHFDVHFKLSITSLKCKVVIISIGPILKIYLYRNNFNKNISKNNKFALFKSFKQEVSEKLP